MKARTRKANLRVLHQPGSYLGVEDKAAHQLAYEIHFSRDDHPVISWAAQEEAMNFFNEHGLSATLDRMFALREARERKSQ